MINYKKAGVNIAGADAFVKSIKGFVSSSKLGNISAFGSLFEIAPLLKTYKEPVLVSSTDGVGTKLKIAIDCGRHNTVGIDLVAMNVNDIVCLGARPLFFLDYIACGRLDEKILKDVVAGIHKGLKLCGCSLLGGETAEMPGMYKKEDYDLAGFCVGIVDREKLITGKNIKAGDAVIGISSSGLHSNGFSLVRKVLSKQEIKKCAQQLLAPTRIYVDAILSLLTAYNLQLTTVKGIAHITGGAFYNKAVKILPKGLGFEINKNSWPVNKIFKIIQEKGCVSLREMFTVFNMGIGMIVVVDKNEAESVLTRLNKYYKAYLIGKVIKGDTVVL